MIKNPSGIKRTHPGTVFIVVVQSLRCIIWLFATACQVSLSVTVFVQTHVHWVDDAIQSSCPLSSASSPAFNLSQHQGLFQWVSSLHQVSKVLELQLQHQSFQWMLRVNFLSDWLVGSCCLRNSQESSPAPQFEKHKFFGAQAFFMVQLSRCKSVSIRCSVVSDSLWSHGL